MYIFRESETAFTELKFQTEFVKNNYARLLKAQISF
jgi:hypothetical protein